MSLTQSTHTLRLLAGRVDARHRLEVLYSGGEMELVAGAGETAKAHPLEAMLDLQVCKAHLDPFARIARSLELRRSLQ